MRLESDRSSKKVLRTDRCTAEVAFQFDSPRLARGKPFGFRVPLTPRPFPPRPLSRFSCCYQTAQAPDPCSHKDRPPAARAHLCKAQGLSAAESRLTATTCRTPIRPQAP